MDNIFDGREAKTIIENFESKTSVPKIVRPIEADAVLEDIANADKVAKLDAGTIAEHSLTLTTHAGYLTIQLSELLRKQNYIDLQLRALMGDMLIASPELQTVYRSTQEDILYASNDKAKNLYRQKVANQLCIDSLSKWPEVLRNIVASLDKVMYAKKQNKSY